MGQLAARLGSSAMADALAANGFDAINVAGGTSAWIRSGRPIEK
jgi:rhodanese-related sulfurtransferase